MSEYEKYGSNYIGSNAKVCHSSNPLLNGIAGKIVDESKNMFTFSTGAGEIRVPKTGSEFMIILKGNEIKINGNDIQFTVQDRMKNTGKIVKSKMKERKR